jgi:hypothetical protein
VPGGSWNLLTLRSSYCGHIFLLAPMGCCGTVPGREELSTATSLLQNALTVKFICCFVMYI